MFKKLIKPKTLSQQPDSPLPCAEENEMLEQAASMEGNEQEEIEPESTQSAGNDSEEIAEECRAEHSKEEDALFAWLNDHNVEISAALDLLEKGLDYDNAVAAARTEGEIAGRNTSICELKEMERASDGVPHPGTGSAVNPRRIPTIFDLAAEANL